MKPLFSQRTLPERLGEASVVRVSQDQAFVVRSENALEEATFSREPIGGVSARAGGEVSRGAWGPGTWESN